MKIADPEARIYLGGCGRRRGGQGGQRDGEGKSHSGVHSCAVTVVGTWAVGWGLCKKEQKET